MLEYAGLALGAWFIGFFPLAEIYVAVPAAMASGLDNLSVIFWTVLGNFTPAILIAYFYRQLMQIERVRNWLSRLTSDRVRNQVDRYGTWFVLLITPWTGIWVMAMTARFMGMNNTRFMISAFISILVYAVVLVLLIQLGISTISA